MVDLLLAAFILTPLILAVLLKSNGALLFLSVCGGAVLTIYVADNFTNSLGYLVRGSLSRQNINLAMLVLPLLLTLLFTRHTVAKRSGFLLRLYGLPAICAGGLLAMAAVPYLSGSMQDQLDKSQIWFYLHHNQAIVITAGVVSSMLIAWITSPRHKAKDKKHKK